MQSWEVFNYEDAIPLYIIDDKNLSDPKLLISKGLDLSRVQKKSISSTCVIITSR